MLLNKAYNTLKSPLLRAQYLIAQHLDLSNEESETLEDKEFIVEVMDAREEIEGAADREELEAILETNQKRIELVLSQVESSIGSRRWQDAKAATVKLKYLEGIREAAQIKADV